MVGTIMPGAIIGEMALLDGGPRTASVRARTDLKAVEVSAAFFQASLGQMDLPAYKILRRVIRGLTDRLSEVRDKIVLQLEQQALEGAKVAVGEAGLVMEPQNTVELGGKKAEQCLKLLDVIDDQDDVQNVWANLEIQEGELESSAG